MDPLLVVQDFITAFNARDVDRVVGCFSADAVMGVSQYCLLVVSPFPACT